jgi:hypothetical protein
VPEGGHEEALGKASGAGSSSTSADANHASAPSTSEETTDRPLSVRASGVETSSTPGVTWPGSRRGDRGRAATSLLRADSQPNSAMICSAAWLPRP